MNGVNTQRWDEVDLPNGWQLPDKRYFMVLNDGETYTELRGCHIVEVGWHVADDPDLDIILENAVRRGTRGPDAIGDQGTVIHTF